MSPSLAQLQPDWLDALAILRQAIDSHDIREVWKSYEPWLIPLVDHPIHLVEVDQSESEFDDGALYVLKISTREGFLSLPKIERVEILTYAACGAWFLLNYPGDPFSQPREAFQQLCFRAGCWHKNTPEIRERWRLIDWHQPTSLLPNAKFEDRPVCVVCKGTVATGGGAWINPKLNPGDPIYARALHEECARYAHRVLAPKIAEARAAEAAKLNQAIMDGGV